MNKLIVHWDNRVRNVPSDHYIKRWSEKVLKNFIRAKENKYNSEVLICSTIQLNEIKLMVKDGHIRPEEIVLKWQGKEIYFDKHGRITEHPDEVLDDQLLRLL